MCAYMSTYVQIRIKTNIKDKKSNSSLKGKMKLKMHQFWLKSTKTSPRNGFNWFKTDKQQQQQKIKSLEWFGATLGLVSTF